MKARTPAVQGRRRHTVVGEDGLTLIELIVAVAVLMITMGATAALLTGAVSLTGQNRDRVAAANLADQEIGAVRSLTFAEVEDAIDAPPAVEVVEVGGIEYRVQRRHAWASVEVDGSACEGPESSGPTHVEVVVEVSSNALGAPVRAQTLVGPSVGDLDPNKAHIGVRVIDREGEPNPGQQVWINHGAPGQQHAYTDDQGCAFFAFLEPGDWEVDLAQLPGSEQVIRPTQTLPHDQTLTSGEMLKLELQWDDAATLELSPAPEHGGQLPVSGLQATVQSLEPVRREDHAWDGGGEGTTLEVGGLYPFRSGYVVWAGESAAPGDGGCIPESATSDGAVMVEPGASSQADVPLATIDIEVQNPPGQRLRNAAVHAQRPDADDDDPDCGMRLELGTTDEEGRLRVAVPFGAWEVSSLGGSAAELVLEPGAGGAHELELIAGTELP